MQTPLFACPVDEQPAIDNSDNFSLTENLNYTVSSYSYIYICDFDLNIKQNVLFWK